MGDFNRFISGTPTDPYENLRIDPVEADKKQREAPYTGLPPASPTLLFAAFIFSLQQVFLPLNALLSRAHLPSSESLLDDVETLRNLLQELADQDLSHDTSYIDALTEVWHNLQDDCNSLFLHTLIPPVFLHATHDFIQKLTHYPPQSDHTLGYYLTESRHVDWLPFPFMEMLQQLHDEALREPHTAPLLYWIRTLSDILSAQNLDSE